MTILLYHSIHPKVDDPLCQVSPDTFKWHLETLLEAGAIFCPLSECIPLKRNHNIENRIYSLTFDDGYEDFVEYALPIIEDLGLASAQFICPAHVGENNRWNYRAGFRANHMNLNTLRDLLRHGISVQPHGWSHRNFLQHSTVELSEDLERCCNFFREELGTVPKYLAYPYGTVRHEQVNIVANRFSAALAVDPLPNIDATYAIPRIAMVEMLDESDLNDLCI